MDKCRVELLEWEWKRDRRARRITKRKRDSIGGVEVDRR